MSKYALLSTDRHSFQFYNVLRERKYYYWCTACFTRMFYANVLREYIYSNLIKKMTINTQRLRHQECCQG